MLQNSARILSFRRDHGSLHVKCAVADASVALISSANLTDYTMSLNMELGVLVKGGLHSPRSRFSPAIPDPEWSGRAV